MDYNQIFNFMTSKYISLGNDCTIAMILAHLNKKQATLPLDWVVCKDFETCINLIDSRFKYFIDDSSLIIKGDNSRDAILSDFIYSYSHNHYKGMKELNFFINKKINIEYPHDFKSKKITNEMYSQVKNKYNRRIERFYNILKGSNYLVQFIFYYPDLNNDNLKKFEKILYKINPKMKYNLNIITHNKLISKKYKSIFHIDKKLDKLWHIFTDTKLEKYIKNI